MKNSRRSRKGRFITLEGGDGAGKTTLGESILIYLRKHHLEVVQTRAPGGTPLGQAIRSLVLCKPGEQKMVKRCELLLFLADRAQHVDEVILPALQDDKVVLCDRFNDSTLAYQSGARGFKEKLVLDFCKFASDALKPDLTLYLDLDPKIAMKRLAKTSNGKDRIEAEDLKFHQNIRKAFHRIAKKEPKRFIIIDASRTPDEVFEQARVKIDALLQLNRK